MEEEIEFEYEDVIEFLPFEDKEYHTLSYSITNNTWKIWYIDKEGEEVSSIIDNIEKLDSLEIDGQIISKEDLTNFIEYKNKHLSLT